MLYREHACAVLVLCAVLGGVGGQVSISGVRLTLSGSEVNHMNLGGSDLSYVLECDYQADSNDVVNVTWTLEDYGEVYSWNAVTGVVDVSVPLQQGVDEDGANVHYTQPTPQMRGLYTCLVYHSRQDLLVNPVRYDYYLRMFAMYHDDYSLSASVENCSVSLNFSTPAMYPKPEVTCGFWNDTENAIGSTLHGGMFYHQFVNLTWFAFMAEVPLEIEDIPLGTTIFCQTDVPFVNYTRITKLSRDASNALVYEEVDDHGCPAIPLADEHMVVDLFECEENCRNECKQQGVSPVVAEFKCASGYEAYWEVNDTTTFHWRLRVTCNNDLHTWSSDGGKPTTDLELPYCIYNAANSVSSSCLLLAFAILLIFRY